MKETKKRNHVNILTIVVMALAMASLTGCSQKAETQGASNAATESTAETNVDETVKSTEEAEASEAEASSEVGTEPTVESTPESATEAVVYEGIDMESDLPTEEWLKTFVGVVDEPAVIIYNDATGRKEIVQEGATVNVNPDEDMMAVYWPKEGMSSKTYAISLKEAVLFANYELNTFDAKQLRTITERPASVTVTGGGEEDWVVNFTMVVE